MFKNLLVPINGDTLTKAELKMATKLAKIDGAKITIAFVSDPVIPYSSSEIQSILAVSPVEYKKRCEAYAAQLFLKARKLIGNGVEVSEIHVYHPNASDGIIEAAKKTKADVIAMASHKRSSIRGLFLRSEAHEVILHSHIPVLILN